MSDILNKLYHGDICPEDAPVKSQRYLQAAAQAAVLQNQLLESLQPPQLTIFRQFLQANDEMEQALSIHSFSCGFRLGAELIEEIFREGKY